MLSLPNIISFLRLLAVPAIVLLILEGEDDLALGLFLLAGLSDAIDGFIAKKFNARTRLGAYLDPLADKALLVSLYVTLGLQDRLAGWLVILVVSRDILIIGAVLLAAMLGARLTIEPIFVSKLNTSLQIVLVGVALAAPALGLDLGQLIRVLTVLVATSTVVSGFAYLRLWTAAVSETDKAPPASPPP